jgi:predicted ATPase
LVLRARCHERESLAFKAVDGIIDGLNGYLKQLPETELAALFDFDAQPLGELFPVLERGRVSRQGAPEVDLDYDRRRRGFDALRELLLRLSAKTHLILFIDDLQWGDQDSAALLRTLLRPPHPPQLLLIASYPYEPSPVLANLTQALASGGELLPDCRVEELDAPARHASAAQLLGEHHPDFSLLLERGQGIPLFICRLAERLRSPEQRMALDVQSLRLADVLRGQVEHLTPHARLLLQVVAVAGAPVPAKLARIAARLDAPGAAAAKDELRRAALLRVHASASALECLHDRIRETVVASLGEEVLRDYHLRLADA